MQSSPLQIYALEVIRIVAPATPKPSEVSRPEIFTGTFSPLVGPVWVMDTVNSVRFPSGEPLLSWIVVDACDFSYKPGWMFGWSVTSILCVL